MPRLNSKDSSKSSNNVRSVARYNKLEAKQLDTVSNRSRPRRVPGKTFLAHANRRAGRMCRNRKLRSRLLLVPGKTCRTDANRRAEWTCLGPSRNRAQCNRKDRDTATASPIDRRDRLPVMVRDREAAVVKGTGRNRKEQ